MRYIAGFRRAMRAGSLGSTCSAAWILNLDPLGPSVPGHRSPSLVGLNDGPEDLWLRLCSPALVWKWIRWPVRQRAASDQHVDRR